MKKSEVQIGKVYLARIGPSLAKVRIIAAFEGFNGRTRWDALNLDTRRKVMIKSAAKLRTEVKHCSHPECQGNHNPDEYCPLE